MIHLNHVVWKRGERTILDDVSWDVIHGEQWVLLGRNGSGKTSILEMIAGYLFPTSGSIQVNGYRFGECDLREVRKKIGYVSQSLFEKLTLKDPVWEVVATGQYGFLRFYESIPDRVREESLEMLNRFGLSDLAEQSLGTLSQGERKKILLSRAMMGQPRLLVMDEPCSGLDLFEREKLLEFINRLTTEHVQMLYVTHHIEEIWPFFTHVALLDEGRLISVGKKHEVLTAERLKRAYGLELDIAWQHDRPWISVLPEA